MSKLSILIVFIAVLIAGLRGEGGNGDGKTANSKTQRIPKKNMSKVGTVPRPPSVESTSGKGYPGFGFSGPQMTHTHTGMGYDGMPNNNPEFNSWNNGRGSNFSGTPTRTRQPNSSAGRPRGNSKPPAISADDLNSFETAMREIAQKAQRISSSALDEIAEGGNVDIGRYIRAIQIYHENKRVLDIEMSKMDNLLNDYRYNQFRANQK